MQNKGIVCRCVFIMTTFSCRNGHGMIKAVLPGHYLHGDRHNIFENEMMAQ